MKNIMLKYTAPIFCLLLLASCTDVVDIDVGDAPVRVVVDAWINNKPEAQTIRLTSTAPYFEAQATPGLEGATVTVSSSAGTVMNFVDTGSGNYTWTPSAGENIGEIGEQFQLDIALDGKNYQSFSTLNRVPEIDSIGQETEEETSFFEERIECQFFARDPIGPGDTYWVKTFQNDQFLNKPNEINIAWDAGFSPGSVVDGLIFIPPIRFTMNPIPDAVESGEKSPSPWNVGDVARVEIHSISNEAFYFLEIVRTQLTNSQNTIFAEPLTNTTGNVINTTDSEEVLGMFVVSAIAEKEITIQ